MAEPEEIDFVPSELYDVPPSLETSNVTVPAAQFGVIIAMAEVD